MPDTPTDPPPRSRLALLGWSAASLALLAAGGLLTAPGLGDWYTQLDFPPYQPPGWVFTPAWLLILTLLALATWRLPRKSPRNFPRKLDNDTADASPRLLTWAYLLYGAQFVLNVNWSLLFFTLRRPDAAFWNLLALDAVVLAMALTYTRLNKPAGRLLWPYVLWLLYATAINAWITLHNGPFG